ncbi:hypothetical protein K7432_009590 [Basidiobolus ranarum]|uniref:Enoyl reductase (ER) domain-containing protein n=1 Tax=Basidiobolus ranarum TaxID=34480 RepID=A0ABR2WQ32_9FUNG
MTNSTPNEIPTEMRAWRWSSSGSPSEVLKLETNLPICSPKPHEVLLKVHATSINPVDSKNMKDNILHKLLKKPFTPCLDIVGTVVEIGKESTKFKIGDKVFGNLNPMKGGGLAEYCLSEEQFLVKAPEQLTDVELATFPLVSLTAWQGIVSKGQVKKGMRILIHGGGGGVGTVSIQLAKYLGAYVICTCSSKKIELVRSLGADQVIDYTIEDVKKILKEDKVDVVFDCVGGTEIYESSLEILKTSGSFITIVGDEPEIGGIGWLMKNGARILSRKTFSYFGYSNYIMFSGAPVEEQLEEVSKLITEGALKPVIDSVYSFEQSVEAFEKQLSGHCSGKVIVQLSCGCT